MIYALISTITLNFAYLWIVQILT